MKLLGAAILGFALLNLAVAQRQKKPPDVSIIETKAIREQTRITVDGKVKVTAEKPVHGLVIVFDFRSPEKEVVTSQKTTIQEDSMEAGREGAFHAEMADAARAVAYTIRAFDTHEKELRVANPGPFIVE
ncbi:MAG TPA: hypothetical protein VKE70_00185 [Candidatus Solibacter sp.]|nr:hypothetical protein [Candidatus Solibacter sp.]